MTMLVMGVGWMVMRYSGEYIGKEGNRMGYMMKMSGFVSAMMMVINGRG